MRVLIAPMMAMAESAGPASRAQILASAMAAKGWEVALCVPEGAPVNAPAGVQAIPVRMPVPLGLPRAIGKRMFPLAQRLGLNRRVPMACFDDVLRLTGNADGRYLEAAVQQMREVIRRERFDAVYSEFSVPAIVAALAEEMPVFGTVSYPTQPSFASDPATVAGVNRVLRSLSMESVRSPEDVLLMPQVRFVPSCRAMEPFPEDAPVVFTGPFAGMPSNVTEAAEVPRDVVVAYLGNGAVTPRRAVVMLAEALKNSGLGLYVAGLPEGFAEGVRTAPRLDFAALLPRAVVFVNHGGQNSVMDGIAFGAPQLICPGRVFERRFNAEAAARNSVGVMLEHECFDGRSVHDAIGQLVDDREKFQDAARDLRAKLSNLGGAVQVMSVMSESMAHESRGLST